MAIKHGSLPFSEQIRFFRRKTNLGTRAWTDLWQAQHDHAFVVAGAMRRELLADFRTAVDRVIANGVTLEQFRKDFDQIVARHGWSYKGSRGWRSRVIYETNLRTSYAAGRFDQMKAIAANRPYWRYRHNDAVEHPRPEHVAWDGLVLPHDDPFWATHFPPNGWGCKCFVETLSARDLERSGKAGPDDAPPIDFEDKLVGATGPTPRLVRTPKGIDPGFGHPPGESAWMEAITPVPMDVDTVLPSTSTFAADALPAPRPQPASRVLPADLPDREYVDRFMREFGVAAGNRTVFEDVAGEFLIISERLFRERDGRIKVGKRERAAHVLLFADTIKLPDEIWEDFGEYGERQVSRRRYIARHRVRGQDTSTLTVFETGPDGWIGVTAFSPSETNNVERRARKGVRVYRRDE